MHANLKSGLLGIAISAMTVASSGIATAQFPIPGSDNNDAASEVAPVVSQPFVQNPRVNEQPVPAPAGQAMPRSLVDSVSESASGAQGRPTAAEMRQARAIYRSKQRMERMERNLWAGYEPLRPNWNSIPMMSSRYRERGTILVPVYFYTR